jgi:predicted Zn-dependent peptidase
VGSIHEPESIRGAAHFVEHMCFKGTLSRPHPEDIFSVYDNVGAFINAYTNKRYTEYIVKVDDKYADNCLHMMADMMMNSTFPRKEFVKEEKVVIEENLRTRDNPNSNLEDMTESLLYQGSSFALPIDMIQYHSKPYDQEKIVDFYRYFYRPENIVLSIVSKVPFRQILRIVNQSFFVKNTPTQYVLPPLSKYNDDQLFDIHPKYAVQYSSVHQTNPIYRLMKKPGVQTIHMNISFRTCNQTSEDKYSLIILANILGGTFGSRLSMLLREKHGLTYVSKATTNYHEHGGDFTIYTQMDSTKLFHNISKNSKGVLPLILDLLSDLLKNGVSDTEFKRAKRILDEKMKMKLEDSAILAEHNGLEWLLYSDSTNIVSYDHYFDRHMKHIRLSDIFRVIRTYFRKDRMVLTMVSEYLPAQSKVERECQRLFDEV